MFDFSKIDLSEWNSFSWEKWDPERKLLLNTGAFTPTMGRPLIVFLKLTEHHDAEESMFEFCNWKKKGRNLFEISGTERVFGATNDKNLFLYFLNCAKAEELTEIKGIKKDEILTDVRFILKS